jgi:hypothetical protein
MLSYEGCQLLEGVVSRDASEMNAVWSGESIRYVSVRHGNVIIRDARLTFLAMIHHGALDSFLRKNGTKYKDNGFLARLLVVDAKDAAHVLRRGTTSGELIAKKNFDSRILELCEANLHAAKSKHDVKEVIP